MKRNRITRVLLVILLLGPTTLGLVSCTAEDISILRDIALLWAAEHAGELVAYGLIGRSGNSEVDAVAGAKAVIDNIQAADKLMDEGRANHDLTKMSQAIKKRPGDYTYRSSYAVEALRQGQSAQAIEQFQAGADAAASYGGSYHSEVYAIQAIDELAVAGQEMQASGWVNTGQCQAYYDQMAYLYGMRYQQTGQQFFLDQQTANAARAGTCE